MQKKEVCWNITTKCNQNCRYCHRFLKINELTYEENLQILKNLMEDGITDITWTGGEALMYKEITSLIKKSFEYGIKNKLITNGKILCNSDMDILNYLDSLTLSIDSTEENTNDKLGRGKNHFENIKYILNYIEENNIKIKVRINTVVCKLNLEDILKLTLFLNKYHIHTWRIFRFMPLRETAIENRKEFEISDQQFEFVKRQCNCKTNIKIVEYRDVRDMEEKYILLVANGDIIVTEKEKDIKKGNALFDRVSKYM